MARLASVAGAIAVALELRPVKVALSAVLAGVRVVAGVDELAVVQRHFPVGKLSAHHFARIHPLLADVDVADAADEAHNMLLWKSTNDKGPHKLDGTWVCVSQLAVEVNRQLHNFVLEHDPDLVPLAICQLLSLAQKPIVRGVRFIWYDSEDGRSFLQANLKV